MIGTGEDWMEYGQSWRWKGEEGMAYAGANGNWRVSRMALFKVSSGRSADVYLTVICKEALWKPGNQ